MLKNVMRSFGSQVLGVGTGIVNITRSVRIEDEFHDGGIMSKM